MRNAGVSELDLLLSSNDTELGEEKTTWWETTWFCAKAILLRALMLSLVLCVYSGFGLMMDRLFGELEIDTFRYTVSIIIAYLMMFWVFLGLVGVIMGEWRWLFNPRFVVERVYTLCSLLAERVQE